MISRVKKVVLFIALLLLVIRIGYIFIYDEVSKNTYTISDVDINKAKKEKFNEINCNIRPNKKYLKAIFLRFDSASTKSKKGYLVINIKKGKKVVYETRLNNESIIDGQWKRLHVNMPISKEGNYKITIKPKEYKQLPKVYMVKDDIAIKYEYMTKPSVRDKVVSTFVSVVLFVLFAIFVLKYRFIEKCIRKLLTKLDKFIISKLLYPLCEVLLGYIITHFSGISFRTSTIVILLLISLFFGLKNNKRDRFIKDNINTLGRKVFLYFIYLYGAFALVGYKIWLYPLYKNVSVKEIGLYIIAVLWFIPIVNGCLYYINVLRKYNSKADNKVKFLDSKYCVILWIAVLIVPSILGLIAFNPGITSADTTSTLLENAHNIKGMVDWHPAFYCMILRVIIGVWDSTYAVIIVQYIVWLYVTIEMLLYLRKKGMRGSIILMAAVFMGTNVANVIHINTIWKDIPYGLILLWSAIILAKLSLDYKEYKSKWYVYGELVIALVNLYFLRKNGMVPVIIIAGLLIVLFRKSKKVIGALGVTLALILLISGPIYDYFDIKDTGKRGMYIGLGQDILGVYYAGGEVSQNTLDMINVMTYGSNSQYYYIPTWSYQSYDLDVSTVSFIVNYLDTFIKNPVIMTKSIIAREDAVWNIYSGQDAFLNCVNYITTEDGVGQWNTYYPKRVNNILTKHFTNYSTFTCETQWIDSVYWRCGIWTLLSFIVIYSMYLKYGMKKYMIIMAPSVGNFLGLVLSTGWSDFRYFWPINLVNVFIILIGFINLKILDDNEEKL